MSGRLLSEAEIAALPPAESDPGTPGEPSGAGETVWREVTPEELAAQFAPVPAEEARWPHEWHTLCWLLASGLSQRQAAAELNYTESRISIICQNPLVAAKTERLKREHYGDKIAKGVARVAPKALDYMEKVVTGQEGTASVGNRLHAAQWILEKHSGKPKQEIVTEGGLGIAEVLSALDALRGQALPREAGALNPPDLETSANPQDPIDVWVSAHVPSLGSEKAE